MLDLTFSHNSFIGHCGSWDQFRIKARALPADKRSDAFVRLSQIFFQTSPLYRNLLDTAAIWRVEDAPLDVREELKLQEQGADLVARDRNGSFWLIKTAFAANETDDLSRDAIQNFERLAFDECLNISHAVVIHCSEFEIDVTDLRVSQIGLDQWREVNWRRISSVARGRSPVKSIGKTPRPHQISAVTAARSHYLENSRGRLIMPCGTGKTLASILIAEELKAQTIIVAAPSLGLIRQNLNSWAEEFDAKGLTFDCICVCSDHTVAKSEDDIAFDVSELGIEITTDVEAIVEQLQRPRKRPLIVFVTYHSSPMLASAARITQFKFDIGFMDEAHRTVGLNDRDFATLLSGANIEITKRVFMTATERVYRGEDCDVLSMDNVADYGECFYRLSFKDAIDQKLICDYKIITFFVSEATIGGLIENKSKINLARNGKTTFERADVVSLASGIALKSVIKEYNVNHIISFHKSIKSAENFQVQQDKLNQFHELGPSVKNLHVSSALPTTERSRIMKEFAESELSCVSNAKCLTEGIDVPKTDCILFEGAKKSIIDIAQAAGRALRNYLKKKFGYIIIPIVVPEGKSFDDFVLTTEFRRVAQTLAAMSSQDERLVSEFHSIASGYSSKGGGIVQVRGDIPDGIGMEFEKFAAAVQTKLWSKEAPKSRLGTYRPFEEAKAFVSSLGLKNAKEWKKFAKSERMPADLPNAADRVYRGKGWTTWGDWLGTGNIADAKKTWRPFEEARIYIRSLGLNTRQWYEYVKTDKKPKDIPATPSLAYKGKGFISLPDFLGSQGIPGKRKAHPLPAADTETQYQAQMMDT